MDQNSSATCGKPYQRISGAHTQWVTETCGKFLYTNPITHEAVYCTKDHPCGDIMKVTKYVVVTGTKCTLNGPCVNHASIAAEIKSGTGCPNTTTFEDELKGTTHTSARCGTPTGPGDAKVGSQDLIMVKVSKDGNTPPPPGTVEYFDLSLQKFITSVNGASVEPSREPEVDVSPLKNENTVPVVSGNVLGGMLTGDGTELESKTIVTSENLGAASGGTWKQDSTGWWYELSDGSYVKNDWVLYNGKYYYCGSDGYMLKGWQTLRYNNRQCTFYFAQSATGELAEGQMATGRQAVVKDGTRAYYYFCEASGTPAGYVEGEMVRSTVYDGHKYGSKGAEVVTTAKYTHPRDAVEVKIGDLVTYTIRVYNEGTKNGYATELRDYIPEHMEYVADNPINQKYGWSVSGNMVSTNYLSNKLLQGYMGGDNLSFEDVQIVLRVKDDAPSNENFINFAEISGYSEDDIDSDPSNFVQEHEDDDDYDVVIVKDGPTPTPTSTVTPTITPTVTPKETPTPTPYTEYSGDITKRWDDQNNKYGLRPSSVTVILYATYADGRTERARHNPEITGYDENKNPIYQEEGDIVEPIILSERNHWVYNFDNIPEKDKNGDRIRYSVEEQATYQNDLMPYKAPRYNGLTITNPLDTIDIKISKIWDDKDNKFDTRPDEIIVRISSNTDIAPIELSLNASNNWSNEITGLPKYTTRGEITYTIEEVRFKIDDTVIEKANYKVYEASKDSSKTSYVITNAFTNKLETTEISGDKIWEKEENKWLSLVRPDAVILTLKGSNGYTEEKEVSSKDNWKYSFTDLPKYDKYGTPVTYKVEETAFIVDGKKYPTSAYTNRTSENNIINTPVTTTISGSKTWKNENDKYMTRPSSISVTLYANGQEMETKTVSGPDWAFSFGNYPVYDKFGNAITYTVDETAFDGKTKPMVGYKKTTNGTSIINELVSIDIDANKVWVDNGNTTKPSSINVVLYANGKEVDRATLSAPNWHHKFENFPKFDAEGNEVTYTVRETEVPLGYEEKANGSNVENDLMLDLSLRKFISAVNDKAVDRTPSPQVDSLIPNGTEKTAKYNHTKQELSVHLGDTVTYTIRVYNEGKIDAYAMELKDYIPDNLEYLPDDSTNRAYGWKLEGNTLTTSYLENTKLSKFDSKELKFADVKLVLKVKDTGLSVYKERLVNIAEISKYGVDDNGKTVIFTSDRDSSPLNFPADKKNNDYDGNGKIGDYVPGQEDDDDFDVVITDKPEDFVDLALRKFITEVSYINEDGKTATIVPENGMTVNDGQTALSREPQVDISNLRSPLNPDASKTAVYNHPKDTVDVAVGDLVTYTIRVYNEGTQLEGVAREIRDYIPDNLEYVSDNEINQKYGWDPDGRTLVTTYLKDTNIAKFDGNKLSYADVQVVLRVKDSTPNNQILVNIAEVSKDGFVENGINDLYKDRDSEPLNFPNEKKNNEYDGNGRQGNYVPGQQDDDDFDRVKLTIKDFGGIVWLDGEEGKQQERNKIYTDQDKVFQGIIVRLEKKVENSPEQVRFTNSSGRYVFKRQYINYRYSISFEYPGQEYIPVEVTELNSGDYTNVKSAGAERGDSRTNLNAKFHEITNNYAQGNGAKLLLEYDKDENKYTSTVRKTEKEITDKLVNIKGYNDFYVYSRIQAPTEDFNGTADFVGYINLGLIERAQTNLGVMSDVNNVELTINGKYENFDYSKRDEKTAVEISAKVNPDEFGRIYNHALYKSDYNFRIEDYKDYEGKLDSTKTMSGELEVYATYKVKVKNYSSKTAAVSGLKLYYDSTYQYLDSWYSKVANQNNGAVKWDNGKDEYNYKTLTTSSIKDIDLAPNEELYVYVKFQVLKDNSKDRNIITGTKYIITEITEYTTPEGLIDINSRPDNVNVENWDEYKKTFEDDTDRAPGLNIYVDENLVRTMTGFVFEDMVSGTDADGVNIGDGVFNGNEKKQDNVIVQLVEKVTVEGKPYEYIWEETLTGSDKVAYMDRYGKLHDDREGKTVTKTEGTYTFKDYIPGDYIVRFIYGDTIVNGTVALSGQDYKSTKYVGLGIDTSGAKDNKARRLDVMKYSTEIDYAKAMILKNTGDNAEELRKNTWMNADTENIPIEIDYAGPKDSSGNETSVNFGVIERPKTKVDVSKDIAAIKVTNNGKTIVNTETGTGIAKGNSREMSVELDDENLNGATLEIKYKITVTNNSDKDTLYNYFEDDAKYLSNQNPHDAVKTRVKTLYDYARNMGFDDKNVANENWKVVSASDLKDTNKLSKAVIDNLDKAKNQMQVLKTTEYKELEPGKTDVIEITLARILSSDENDWEYNNSAEIIEIMNGVGRRDERSIDGNYPPAPDDSEELNPAPENPDNPNPKNEPDSSTTSVKITEPTGLQTEKPHYEIWIASLAIIAVGIVLIKVLVLKKKE